METIKNVLHIKRNVFEKVRLEDDFAALNRVGWLHNALAYMVDLFYETPDPDPREPLTLRTFHRTTFPIAGYAYEGYKLVESLSYKYVNEPFFERFAAICKDSEKARKKKVMRLMRDAVAFHLDADNTYTKKALANLKLNKIPFLSGDDDGRLGSMYFHLSDVLDINYVIDELKTEGTAEEDIHLEMGRITVELARDFLLGCDQFAKGISYRLGLLRA